MGRQALASAVDIASSLVIDNINEQRARREQAQAIEDKIRLIVAEQEAKQGRLHFDPASGQLIRVEPQATEVTIPAGLEPSGFSFKDASGATQSFARPRSASSTGEINLQTAVNQLPLTPQRPGLMNPLDELVGGGSSFSLSPFNLLSSVIPPTGIAGTVDAIKSLLTSGRPSISQNQPELDMTRREVLGQVANDILTNPDALGQSQDLLQEAQLTGFLPQLQMIERAVRQSQGSEAFTGLRETPLIETEQDELPDPSLYQTGAIIEDTVTGDQYVLTRSGWQKL